MSCVIFPWKYANNVLNLFSGEKDHTNKATCEERFSEQDHFIVFSEKDRINPARLFKITLIFRDLNMWAFLMFSKPCTRTVYIQSWRHKYIKKATCETTQLATTTLHPPDPDEPTTTKARMVWRNTIASNV